MRMLTYHGSVLNGLLSFPFDPHARLGTRRAILLLLELEGVLNGLLNFPRTAFRMGDFISIRTTHKARYEVNNFALM